MVNPAPCSSFRVPTSRTLTGAVGGLFEKGVLHLLDAPGWLPRPQPPPEHDRIDVPHGGAEVRGFGQEL